MEMDQQKIIKVRIRRCKPAEGKKEEYTTYEVPIEKGWSVSNVLKYINEHVDGGLAHYLSCRRGICQECIVRVNGKPKLACMEMVFGDITL